MIEELPDWKINNQQSKDGPFAEKKGEIANYLVSSGDEP